MKETIKKAFLGRIIFSGTSLLFFLGFATYTNLPTQNTGDTINQSIWNNLINTVNSIGAKTDGIYNNGGNIGIGTNSPQAKLNIEGNNNLNDNTNIAKSLNSIFFVGTGSDGIGIDSNQIERTNNLNPLYINFNSTSQLILNYGLGNGGNVGIGTTTPSAKLEVNGDLKVNGRIQNNPDFMAQTMCGVMNTAFDYGAAYKFSGGDTCANFCIGKENGRCVGGLLASSKTARFDCTYSLPVSFTDGYCCCR